MYLLTILSKNRLAVTAVLIMGVLGLLAHHIASADAAFSHSYYAYAAAADDADTAVYIPTATNNPIREQMNTALRLILVGKMTDAQRLAYAKQGLELLKGSKAQIDAITPKLDAMQSTIDTMAGTIGFGDALFQRGDPQKILIVARERASTMSDIRALSYRADFETEKIFKHLIETEGKLSDAYVTELNNELPAEQDSFDQRQKRYSQLPAQFDQIRRAFADFSSISH